MPSVNPVTDFIGFTPTTPTSSAATSGLGKDTFLKLLVAQMRQQNPMEPTDDKEMIAQMTQMSMLEQITNMATDSKQASHRAAVDQAVGLMGKTVTYKDEDDVEHKGTVQKVSIDEEGAVTLTVDGKTGVTPGSVTEVV